MDSIKHLLILGEPLHTYCGKVLTTYNDGVFDIDIDKCNCEKCLENVTNVPIVVYEQLIYQWTCPLCSCTNSTHFSYISDFKIAKCKSCGVTFKNFRKLGFSENYVYFPKNNR